MDKKFVYISGQTEGKKLADLMDEIIKPEGKYYKCIVFAAETKEIYNRGSVYGMSSSEAKEIEDALHYNTTLGDLTLPASVGGIPKGTKASDLNGKTMDEMMNMLLFPEINPTISAPSASTKFASGFSANGVYEVGATFPTTSNMGYDFNRGSIVVPGLSNRSRAGAATGATYAVSGKASSWVSKFEEGTYTITGTVSFAQGDVALTSYSKQATKDVNGNTITNPLAAGSLTASGVKVYGAYAIYASTAEAGTLTKQTLTNNKSALHYTLKAGSGQVFAVKGTCSRLMEFNSVSGKYDINKLTDYDTESITIQDAAGVDVTYTKYTRKDDSGDDVLVEITFA